MEKPITMHGLTPIRIASLIADFPHYLGVFEQRPSTSRYGQLKHHLETIRRRRELGSVLNAINDKLFLDHLYRTLQIWGIGTRAPIFRPYGEFVAALRAQRAEIGALERLSIDDHALDVNAVGDQIWNLINTLKFAENRTQLVPGTTALHHLLPELIVPINRPYTQRFFRWQESKLHRAKSSCFAEAFVAFAAIARQTNPAQYIDNGWNSSLTKVIDNALVGMLYKEHTKPKQHATRSQDAKQ